MTVTATQLLVRAAARFRSYEANHRDKVGKITSDVKDPAERNRAIEGTLSKAQVNSDAAFEIEKFLHDNPDFETVGSSDISDDRDVQQLIGAAFDGYLELETLRHRVAFLEPKAHAYDTVAQLTRLSIGVPHPEGARVDPVWQLKHILDRLRKREVAREERRGERAKVAS